jgi:hypothetical protein
MKDLRAEGILPRLATTFEVDDDCPSEANPDDLMRSVKPARWRDGERGGQPARRDVHRPSNRWFRARVVAEQMSEIFARRQCRLKRRPTVNIDPSVAGSRPRTH